ncbi:MAG: thiolase family protein [Acidimicrobiia bacterium]|nr:thiolase family protein [Acidimicrobiia bacterium]
MARTPYEGVFVVGAGQTVYQKRSDKTVHRVIWEALDAGLRSARLAQRDVQGLALTCFLLPPDNVTTVCEHFGIEARFLFQGLYGGASSIIGMLHAARAIRDGNADVVACVAADAFDVAAHNEMLDRFNGPMRDYLAPYGFGGANGVFALHTRLYMETFGARREDFGRLCVAQRANAGQNPNALLRTPMSLDDYLNARLIAEPLRLYDCVMPCVGGDAVILASEQVARRLGVPLVRIAGGGEMHNYPANDVYSLRGGWERIAPRMYEQAGCGPRDLAFAQLYDDYPVMEAIQLEGLGIAPRGKAHEWLRANDTTWRGTFPINTGGGQLSAGQAGASGGMIGVVEGVLQLRGEGGERQVKNAKRGIVAGYGLVAYGRGQSASAAVLERVD